MISIGLFTMICCSSEFNVQTNICPKQISLINTNFADSGFTIYKLYHDGFCYENIDTLKILKEFLSGKKNVYLLDTLNIAAKNVNYSGKSENNTNINLKLIEPSDTSLSISTKLTAIYQNNTESNTIGFIYQLPCKKRIDSAKTKLIDTMVCITSAGLGDRYLVTFEHRGYCVNEIDSIACSGNFFASDGYLWNNSTFLVPCERIVFQKNDTYLQKVSFKVCVTNNYADYVDTQFYIIYKGGDKSNIINFKLFYSFPDKKLIVEKNSKSQIE